jgi:ribonuclease P protein component
VQRHGRRLWGRRFIFYFGRPSTAVTRLGITASRKVGNAVIRNRIKRWVREIFRQNPQIFPRPVDVVVIVKRGIDDFSYRTIEEEFTQVVSRYFEDKPNRRPSGPGQRGGGGT